VEFRATSLDFSARPELEDEARLFLEEEAYPSEDETLDEFAVPPKPPIELKPLPSGLRYAFLGNNLESPIIVSDKLTQKQTLRLLVVLEKQHSTFVYSLQDHKGIIPTLCTHRIPIDPNIPPSREPKRRLHNATREVVKKELLKLLHEGIVLKDVSPYQLVYGKTLGHKKDGIWTCPQPASIESFKSQNWKNGERNLITMPESTRKEPKDGMISKSSKKSSILATRFLCSTPGSNFFGHGKLRSKWEGPYVVIDSATHGAVTLQDNDGNIFMVNGHRLNLFYEHEPLEKEVDTIDFVLNLIN